MLIVVRYFRKGEQAVFREDFSAGYQRKKCRFSFSRKRKKATQRVASSLNNNLAVPYSHMG
ncbi:hypothetical protein ACMGC7_18875, partial [Morganella morganii]|uniref:hypothetical protein n=1 Tax=Morganella morganii TaxID=582 RepID=UPI003EC1501F